MTFCNQPPKSPAVDCFRNAAAMVSGVGQSIPHTTMTQATSILRRATQELESGYLKAISSDDRSLQERAHADLGSPDKCVKAAQSVKKGMEERGHRMAELAASLRNRSRGVGEAKEISTPTSRSRALAELAKSASDAEAYLGPLSAVSDPMEMRTCILDTRAVLHELATALSSLAQELT